MSLIHDDVFDNGLQVLSAANELWIVSGASDPADYAAAVSVRVAIKTAPTISAPHDGSPGGRAVTVSAFSDGSVTATSAGATRWMLVDTVGSRVLTCRKLVTEAPTFIGNTFALPALTVTIPDPAAD
jgi:hypothetical protein